jgi:hypothetical protein
MARQPSTIVYQAEPDGTLSQDYDGPHPLMAEREDLLRRSFEGGGWTVSALQSNEQHRKTTLTTSKGDREYLLDIFIFPNLAWSSGSRDKKEKRIQLSRDYAEHAEEFNLPKDGPNRCLLLGIYRRREHVVFCAWDAHAYRDHPNPNSCYVRVEAIADAMRVGLGQSIDSKDRLVCCFKPDLLAYYVENMQALHDRVVVNEAHLKVSPDDGPDENAGETAGVLGDVNEVPVDLPRNRIVYGAPGTGKSHLVNDQVAQFFGQSDLHERVTFHPEFTYAQFVGSYRPVPLYRPTEVDLVAADLATSAGKHEPIIDYRFVPGPFLRLVTRALKNPLHSFVLVIEELNRANAPAVFGEAFQLLDRDESGEGKFTVELPPEARDYMRAQGLTNSVKLPRNFYLWATMNSADQGVLPLDAAFKRRWSFQYVPLDMGEAVVDSCTIQLSFLPEPIKWNDFRRVVNAHLARREVAEDRLLGPFFMRPHELSSADAFVNKLLLYLRDDVLRHNPEVLFRGTSLTYGALVKSYQAGENIFVEDVSFGMNGSG